MKIRFFLPFLLIFFTIFRVSCQELPTVSERFLKDYQEISFITQYNFFSSDRFWNKKGRNISAYNKVTHQSVSLFAEYGIASTDTVGLYTFYAQNHEEMNRSPRGIGDLELVWKHFISSIQSYDFSFQIIGIIPTGDAITSVRYGEWGIESDLHCQKNFTLYERFAWFEVLAGYRYYHGSPSDQLRGQIIGGYYLLPSLKLICEAAVDYSLSLKDDRFEGPVLIMPMNYRLLQTREQLVWDVSEWVSVYIGSSQNLYGRNIGAEISFFGGIWFDYALN